MSTSYESDSGSCFSSSVTVSNSSGSDILPTGVQSSCSDVSDHEMSCLSEDSTSSPDSDIQSAEGSEFSCSDTDTDSDTGSESSSSESEDADHESMPIHPSADVPLYAGSSLSVFSSHLLLYQFTIKHGLTNEGCSELLQLLKMHMPSLMTENLPKSTYALKQFFTNLFPDLVSSIHYYCSCCRRLLDEVSSCEHCAELDVCTVESFISVPLEAQLKHIMEDHNIWNALQQRFERCSLPNIIQDIFDGEEYKKHADFLSKPGNISLTCNCDGVALFRSSKVEIWPVWLSINELPMDQRFLNKNIVLGALWFSAAKPTINTFLRPLVNSFNDLYAKGFFVESPVGKTQCHAVMLQLSSDLPARALLANMKQFNGHCACIYCENPGTTLPGKPLHRFWPHIEGVPLRTHDSIIANAVEATSNHKATKGVHGATVLCLHKPLDMVKSFVVDDLHCLFLGVTKTLLSLWFDSKYREHDFYLGQKVDLCDKRIMLIQVPDTISRVPRKVSDKTHWKASQFRSWLLFYSLPVMKGILSPAYFAHYCLLVAALHILSSDYIPEVKLNKADKLLFTFYTKFSELYGDKRTTMNIHLLLHLATCVKHWGPLWAYSCFAYESMNRVLKSLFRGTRNMSKQLAFSYVMQSVLPKFMETSQHSCGRKRKFKLSHLIEANVYALGALQVTLPCIPVLELLQEHFSCHVEAVQVFYRLLVGNEIFFCRSYARVKKRNSYTVLFKRNESFSYGMIVQFFLVNSSAVALIERMSIVDVRPFSEDNIEIVQVKRLENRFYIVDIHDIKEKCVCVDVKEAMYVCRFPCKILCD